MIAEPYKAALLAAGIRSIAWIETCDPKICKHAEWAVQEWNSLLVPSKTSPSIPIHVNIGDVGKHHTLGTFTGCNENHGCNIIIDKGAFPALVKVTLLHEIGHALGIHSYPETPYAKVESQFGPKAKLWLKRAHWSQQGLLMSTHIKENQHIEYADAAAVARATNATLRGTICGSPKDCKRGHICAKMAWPSPKKCITGTAKIEATALSLTAVAAASVTSLVILTGQPPATRLGV